MNKFNFIVTIIVLFITTISFGQNINLNQGYAAPKEYVVSIPYIEIKGKILIDVVVNKKKVYSGHWCTYCDFGCPLQRNFP